MKNGQDAAQGADDGREHPLFGPAAWYRLQLFATACGPLFTLCALVGWIGLAQGLAPYDPAGSPAAFAAAYTADSLGIRLGCTLLLVGCGLLQFWIAQLALMMARREGHRPLLAIIQVLGGFGVVAFVSSACCLWIGAAYRSPTTPDVTVALNDAGWFTFLLTWPGLSVQLVAVGLVIWATRDRPDRMAPGSVAIYCFVAATAIALVAAPAFAQEGPFAWNGALGYYIPFVVWAISFELLSWSMYTTLRREHGRPAEHEQPRVPATH